ncbi:MAG: MarR family transcriptional regulator, partial [Chloroflexi bacterium]|nr:MarR family transcriptional regulator [Chloroflexota bacterium]
HVTLSAEYRYLGFFRLASLEFFVDEIDRLSRRLMRNLECCDRMLVSCCNITASQAYSLLALHESGMQTMNELATEMRLHGTTMTRMVDSLVEKGLAERRQDPEDRRIVRVTVSARGQQTVDELQRCKSEFLAAAFAGLADGEREAILKGLRRLTETAEEMGARCCTC